MRQNPLFPYYYPHSIAVVSRYFSSRRTLSALLTQTLSALPAAAGGRRLTCLPDVSAGRNATWIALGAGDAGVMDAGEWVVLCG